MNFLNFLPIDKDGKISFLGFNFYTDDLLILAILYFLYSQNVKDKFLYIALILLLINK